MATHSSILTWEILWAEEPGGLQFIGHKELDMPQSLNNNNFLLQMDLYILKLKKFK